MNLTHGLTPKRLRNILELADQGDILEQHLLFADMEDRCEHLAAEMGKRKRALLTLDWEILPGRANDARAFPLRLQSSCFLHNRLQRPKSRRVDLSP